LAHEVFCLIGEPLFDMMHAVPSLRRRPVSSPAASALTTIRSYVTRPDEIAERVAEHAASRYGNLGGQIAGTRVS
jgi:hypothetical protein